MTGFFSFPVLLALGFLGLAVAAFVIGALLWLRRLRLHVAGTVADALTRQQQHNAKVEEALQLLQRNQKEMEGHVTRLVQAHNRARSDINTLAQRFEQRPTAIDVTPQQSRMLH